LGTDWKKIIFPQSLSVFLSSNLKKKHDKISAHRYLAEIPLIPQRDNGRHIVAKELNNFEK